MSLTPFYMDPLNDTEKITPYKLFSIWVSESFEIFVVLVIFKVILEKPITYERSLKLSLMLGAVVLMIGLYNKDLKKSLKVGIMGSVGSKLVTV